VVEATDPFYAWWQVCEVTAAAMAAALEVRGIDLDRLGEQAFADGDEAGAPCAGYLDGVSVR